MAVTDLGSPAFALHPLHGIHQPTRNTPARRPRSVRRTSSIDMTREQGTLDPVYLFGCGRDLWTDAAGAAAEIGRVSLTATAEMITRVMRRIDTEPAVAGISQLAGAGTTTCTHLNDLLRSVADAAALISKLREFR